MNSTAPAPALPAFHAILDLGTILEEGSRNDATPGKPGGRSLLQARGQRYRQLSLIFRPIRQTRYIWGPTASRAAQLKFPGLNRALRTLNRLRQPVGRLGDKCATRHSSEQITFSKWQMTIQRSESRRSQRHGSADVAVVAALAIGSGSQL